MTPGPITRASFAASGTASGLVSNGVAFFLLIYYSQVLGLGPALALFYVLAIVALGRYRLDRQSHAENLRLLARSRPGPAASSSHSGREEPTHDTA